MTKQEGGFVAVLKEALVPLIICSTKEGPEA